MDQFESVKHILRNLIDYAHRLDKKKDVMSLSFLKKDLKEFCKKYEAEGDK